MTYHLEIAGYSSTAYGTLNLAASLAASPQQVNLYSQANFTGSLVWSGGTGFSNGPSANSYSMQVPNGWSVKTWRQDNRGGEERCWSTSVTNLQDHGWHNAIQSIEVFSTNVCAPTPTPTPTNTPPATSCPTITAWKGEYWNNETLSGTPALCRNDANINFEWQTGSPASQIQADHFSARWTRSLSFSAGTYRFSILHDDGARLYVDGIQVFQNWCSNCSLTETVDVPLTPGVHEIKMEMRENIGWAAAGLSWQSLPTPTATWTATPGSAWTWAAEAENGSIYNPNVMQTVEDSTVSACRYIKAVVNNNLGHVQHSFNVPTAGNYYFWARAMGLNLSTNSFWVSIDGGEYFHYQIPPVGQVWTWGWSQVYPSDQVVQPIYLGSGTHTIRFESRESLSRLDRVLVTNSASFVPGPSNVVPCQTTPTHTPTATPSPSATPTPTATPSSAMHPWLALRFENSFAGDQGEVGQASGVTFVPGRNGQGALFNDSDTLSYDVANNLAREAGAVEFWIKPNWSGGDGNTYVFFEVGTEWNWFNRMRISKDGAGYLRFIVWSPTRENGVTTSVAQWSAGQWHRVKVTWDAASLALYIDGTLMDLEYGIDLPATLENRLYIGSGSNGFGQANAVLDDFVIFASQAAAPTHTPTPAATHTPTVTNTPTPTATPVSSAFWSAQFYANETLSGSPVLTRQDTDINFEWAGGSPGANVPHDSFSARWTRTLAMPQGTYEFRVLRDDGARLWIDNQLVLDRWTWGRDEHLVTSNLSAGSHTIRFEVYEIDGWARAGLSWRNTSQDRRVFVPMISRQR